jgi:hypothetical protein
MARAIHQEQDFNASPGRIYEALLDAKQFSAFSGGLAAEINREAGGAFLYFRWPHCGTKPGVGTRPPDRPGLARGSVAGGHLFDRQV